MTVSQVAMYALSVPLKTPFVVSLGPMTRADNVIVVMTDAAGRRGFGEASPFPSIHGETQATALALAPALARQLIGLPVAEIAEAHRRMNRVVYGNNCIKSAFDMALYDLRGQAENRPVHELLGGLRNPELFTDYTVSLGDPDTMAGAARDIQAAGFPVIKVKLGATDGRDPERIRTIRAAVGDTIPLRIDANQGWPSVDFALETLRQLAPFGIQHCEAPIDRRAWMDLPRLRAASPIPIMADEACWDSADARRLLAVGAVDSINIKLSKCAGLHDARRIVDLATAAGLPLQVGGFLESRLGFTAAAHLAASTPQVKFVDFDTPLMQVSDVVSGGITYGPGGRITLPTGAGLGAFIAPERLAELERITVN